MLLHGDCLEQMRTLSDNSVDCCVTDPPYALTSHKGAKGGFMGKTWDADVPSVDVWREVFRVLKPGGHLLSFGGTRTYHRMVQPIEDAGFEIRDQIMWLYGSGFPKSQNVAIQIDKQAGAMGHRGKALNMSGAGERADIETYDPSIGMQSAPAHVPITDDAKQWQGWGTALKPANEPIVLARKPLEKGLTVAENVLKFGTGALNIDGTRISGEPRNPGFKAPNSSGMWSSADNSNLVDYQSPPGRWPANLILDETAAQFLDEQSIAGGIHSAGKGRPNNRDLTTDKKGMFPMNGAGGHRFDDGASPGASRFFYVAKSSRRERNAGLEGMPLMDAPGSKRSAPAEGRSSALGEPRANGHPTVKPIKLMEYLIKLVCPPGGIVLDPFLGSGSTLVAAKRLGAQGIGIERESEYLEIARRRIEHACQES